MATSNHNSISLFGFLVLIIGAGLLIATAVNLIADRSAQPATEVSESIDTYALPPADAAIEVSMDSVAYVHGKRCVLVWVAGDRVYRNCADVSNWRKITQREVGDNVDSFAILTKWKEVYRPDNWQR